MSDDSTPSKNGIQGAYKRKEYGWFILYILAVVMATRLAGLVGCVVSVLVVAGLYQVNRNPLFSFKRKVAQSVLYVAGGLLLASAGIFLLSNVLYKLWPEAYIGNALSNAEPVSSENFTSSSTPSLVTEEEPNNSQGIKYSDPKWGFSLNYPEGWTVDTSGENAVVEFDDPSPDTVALMTVDASSAEGFSLTTYSQAVIQNFKDSAGANADLKIVSQGNTSLAGQPAYEFEVTYNYVNAGQAYPFRAIYIISLNSGKGYVIFGSSLESVWSKNVDLFNSSALSFRFPKN